MGIHACLALGYLAVMASSAVELPLDPPTAGSSADAILAEARDTVRGLKAQGIKDGGVTIWLRDGVYPLTESFLLGAEDSGMPESPVVYRAINPGKARLIGGVQLAEDAFSPVNDPEVIQRLPEEARGVALVADLSSLSIEQLGVFPDQFNAAPVLPELFFNGNRLTLARWPNQDWATIVKVVESGPAPWRQHASDKPGVFEYDGDRPSRWTQAPEVWLRGYWCFDWSCDTIKVARIDPSTRQIELAKTHVYGIGSGNPAARRYHATNLLEELDAPGEYFIDRKARLLYLVPPGPMEHAEIILSVLTAPAITLEGVSHVSLQGLAVEACAGTGIRVHGGRENQIAGCHVHNTGIDGIVVEDGEQHRVMSCDIHDTGMGGLRISGGDRKTLTPCGHEAVNNWIHHVSRRQPTHAYQVHVGGVGVRIAHNLIHDAPHQAIGLGGNDHLIEFNEIHHTGMETDDCGAFYMGRNPSERGTVIRHNFWHHIGSSFAHGSCAVYFDDGTGGQTVYGNVFYRAAGGNFGAVFMHGGHDNIVENNLFIACKKAMGHAPWHDALWAEWVQGDLWKERLTQEVDITSALYLSRYPDLKGFFDPEGPPRLNRASHNVAVRCDAFADGDWAVTDTLILRMDPGFVDAEAMDFRLTEKSVISQAMPAFQDIPFDQIGLFVDDWRRELPPRAKPEN